jgi:putative peptidoglycan lipid II flippase
VPCAVALVVVPVPLVSVLFERGQTTAADSAAIALAVAIYGLGLPAFVLQKILQPLFFAREDTRSPFRYAVVAMVINAVVAIGLPHSSGFSPPAIGTTLAAWAMVVLLWRGSRTMGFEARSRRPVPRPRPSGSCWPPSVMGATLWSAALWIGPGFEVPGLAVSGARRPRGPWHGGLRDRRAASGRVPGVGVPKRRCGR